MYKTFEKAGFDVMYYKFYSLSEYVDFLNKGEICSQLFTYPSSISKSFSFTKTKSFEEAINLCKYGYHEDYEKLINLKAKLDKCVKLSKKMNKQFNDYIGYTPDVKAYLEGSPISMLNKKVSKRNKIDIYFNTSYNSSASIESIYNRGAIILVLIEILENLGFNVDFHVFEMSYVCDQLHYSDFILKKENERTNPQKLYFPLCHPSWIRRLNFRLIEITKEATNYGWESSYGHPSDIQIIKKIIEPQKNDIIIPTIDEIGIKGLNIIDDANSLINYINDNSLANIELQHIRKYDK